MVLRSFVDIGGKENLLFGLTYIGELWKQESKSWGFACDWNAGIWCNEQSAWGTQWVEQYSWRKMDSCYFSQILSPRLAEKSPSGPSGMSHHSIWLLQIFPRSHLLFCTSPQFPSFQKLIYLIFKYPQWSSLHSYLGQKCTTLCGWNSWPLNFNWPSSCNSGLRSLIC